MKKSVKNICYLCDNKDNNCIGTNNFHICENCFSIISHKRGLEYTYEKILKISKKVLTK